MEGSAALKGRRILVVEDEYFIASDLRRALQAAEADVVGPASDLERGLALLNEARLDAAVLDVNLEGNHSFPIADRLAALAVPYVFLTGYDGWTLPDRHRAAPRFAKPFATKQVVAALAEIVAAAKVV